MPRAGVASLEGKKVVYRMDERAIVLRGSWKLSCSSEILFYGFGERFFSLQSNWKNRGCV